MLSFLQETANNLADGLFYVNIPLTAACAAVGAFSWRLRDFGVGKAEPQRFASDGYANSTWRIFTCAQTTGVAWAAWLLTNSVPAPDYIHKTTVVERQVSVASTYRQAFEACEENLGDDLDTEEIAYCDRRALVLTKPNVFIRESYPVEVKVPVTTNYQQLYDGCMRHYPKVYGSDRDSIDQHIRWRMDKCHEQAKAAAQLVPTEG